MDNAKLRGGYVELNEELWRVVSADGDRRTLHRVDTYPGETAVEFTVAAADLRPARASTLRWYAALRMRRALDEPTGEGGQELRQAAEALAALVLDEDLTDQEGVAVCGYRSSIDEATVVDIDTVTGAGRLRVHINDGVIYDGDPDTDNPPGAHYGGLGWDSARGAWHVRDLRTGDIHTIRAATAEEATRRYLETVSENLLVWAPPA